MRFIRKQHEPPELKKWKRIIRPTASTNWKELDIKRDEINPDKSVKQIVTESLMVEQGFICCYCEQQIPPDPEHPHHRQIEHYKPQDHFPETRFEYNNFGACCLGGSMSNEEEQKSSGERNLIHCGQSKLNDINLHISPLNPNCGTYFRFQVTGRVKPTDNPQKREIAKKAIEQLNLNSEKLKMKRRKAILSMIERTDVYNLSVVNTKIRSLQNIGFGERYEPFVSAKIQYLQSLIW